VILVCFFLKKNVEFFFELQKQKGEYLGEKVVIT
jgi:hypothetical protein